MFWSIFSPILYSFSTVFWKKSLDSSGQLPTFVINSLGMSAYVFFIVYIFWAGYFSYDQIPVSVIIATLTISIFWILIGYIWEYVYKHEKVSVIAPYENLNKVISIIASFFLFGGVSYISLGIGILVIIIVIWASLDFKDLKLPKFIKLFTFHQVLVASNMLLIGYSLENISSIDYFVLENVCMIILFLIILIYRREIKYLKWGKKAFYFNRFLASLTDAGAYFISLFIIASVGVMMNILISFLYLACIMIVGYIVLWDTPDKKSIFLSFGVSILVALAFYFN